MLLKRYVREPAAEGEALSSHGPMRGRGVEAPREKDSVHTRTEENQGIKVVPREKKQALRGDKTP